MSKIHSDLGAAYDAAFIFPFAKYAWKSRRARSCWIDLELLQDALAGPVWSIIKDGDCAYVYARDDDYFNGVKDPAGLHVRLQRWHSKLVADLEQFAPTSPAEACDFATMRRFAKEMWSVTEQAIDIERARWHGTTA